MEMLKYRPPRASIFSAVVNSQSLTILLKGDAEILVNDVSFYGLQNLPGQFLARTVGLLLLSVGRHVLVRTNQNSPARALFVCFPLEVEVLA